MSQLITEMQQPFSADKPINSHTEDRLGRRRFAEALARAIESWRGIDSLVVGICGPWGSGKSSIRNMTREALGKEGGPRSPILVDFNAWEFSGQDQLSEAFFAELGATLGRVDATARSGKLESKFKLLGKALRFVGEASGAVKTAIRVGGAAAAATGAVGPEIAIASEALALTAEQAQVGMSDLGSGAEAMGQSVSGPAPSVTSIKAEISELLQGGERNVVVFLDDIDRLSASEIRLLLRLVKVNADLPKLVFVLLFQRDVVERALQADTAGSGREFLSKIIQAPFDLPAVSRSHLRTLLYEGLNEILADPRVDKSFRQRLWRDMGPAVEPYFRTVRDVRRLVTSLRFHVGLFLSDLAFEVCITDLIGLEVLRVFEPDLYSSLFAHRSILVGEPDIRSMLLDRAGAVEERARKTVQSLLAAVDAPRQQAASDLLKVLFPPLGSTGRSVDRGERDLRACSSSIFDRYFQLTVPAGEISQQQFEVIARGLADRTFLGEEFERLRTQDLLIAALEKVGTLSSSLDLSHALPLVTAVFDIGDRLPVYPERDRLLEPTHSAARLVHLLLSREKAPEKREEILRMAVEATTGLHVPCYLVNLEARPNPSRDTLIGSATLPEFQRICAEKIARDAETVRLAQNPHLQALLHWWGLWAGSDAPREWVAAQLEATTEGTLLLLTAFVRRGHDWGSVNPLRNYIYLQQLERFANVEVLRGRIEAVPTTSLQGAQRTALEAFHAALERRRLGKPEDVPFDHFDEEDTD